METHEPLTGSLPLQILDDNHRPPKRRVKDSADAMSIVRTVVYAGRDRARFHSKVKGMLDGNPPLNSAELKKNGQGYRTNFNPLEGKASLSAGLVPYYDLFAGSQYYAQVVLDLDNPDDKEAKSQIVTEEFDLLLKSYRDGLFQMNSALFDFLAFGRGFLTFPHAWGFHWEHRAWAKVFVPDGTRASVDKLEILVVREKYEMSTLWGFIRDRSTAETVGWKPDVVADAMRRAQPEIRQTSSVDVASYDYIQQRMRDRDLAENYGGSKQPTVMAAHILVKEYDGTVTHMIVKEEGSGVPSGEPGPTNFLFFKQGCFETFWEHIHAFFLETLDGSWNGTRGIGDEIYPLMETKARLTCKTVDNAFLTSSITLQAVDGNSYRNSQLVQAGDINILPPGYNVPSNPLLANSEPLYEANQLIENIVTSNTGIFRAKAEKPQGNPLSATEAQLRFQSATILSNSGVGRFYQQLDPFYAEVYRRVSSTRVLSKKQDASDEAEAIRKFRDRCVKRGVTLEELKRVESVRAMRNIGNGSQTQRQQILTSFAPFVPMLPESGRMNWLNMLVASMMGQNAVNLLNPPRDRQLLPNDQQAYAILENAALKAGAPVTWTPTQNNVIHATEHMKAMAGGLQSLQQGAQPIEVLGFLEMAGPHTQQHLQKLATDPSRKNEFQMLSQQFAQITQVTDQLHKQVQDQQAEQQKQQQEMQAAQQQAQAINQGTDPDTMIATAKAKHDMALREAKVKQALDINAAKSQQKMAINDILTATKLRHAHATTLQNLGHAHATTAQDMAISEAQAAQDMHIRRINALEPTETVVG